MKNLKLLSALCLLLPLLASAQFTGGIGRGDVTRSYTPHRITTQSVASPICAGSSVSVPFQVAGFFTFIVNTFTVQLSDASGSFLAPTTIGSVTSVSSGIIVCAIPPGTPSGAGYRIRVVSSSPAVIGTDNGSDLAINAPPGATIAYAASPYCSNGGTATVDRTGTAGGTYTASPAGLSIAAATGAVDLGASTPGTYTVTYTIPAAGCAQFQTTGSITVSAAPSATIAYAASPYCGTAGTATVDRTGTAGGTYTATPAGLSIAAATGAVDLGASTAGTYTVTYTIAASGGCAPFQTTANIVVSTAPSATITYAASPSCGNVGTAIVVFSGTAGGAYTASPAGLSITGATGAVDLGASTPGTYTVTYTIAAAGGCAQFQTTGSITVSVAPSATITAVQDPLCNGEQSGSIDLGINGGTPPITYAWSNGSQVQDPSGLGAGVYTVVITDQFGCEASASATLTDPAPLSLTATTTSETQGNDGVIDLQVSGGTPPYTYAWSNGSTAQDLEGLAGGTYSAEVTDANGCPVTLQVVVVSTVGLDELELGPEWTVALDGGAQLLTVSADMPFKAVELMDASGRVILSKQELSLIASVGVGHLSSGVYLVRLSFDEGPSLKRLFIGW